MGSSDTGHNADVRRYSIDDIRVYVLKDLDPNVYPPNENKSQRHPAHRSRNLLIQILVSRVYEFQ